MLCTETRNPGFSPPLDNRRDAEKGAGQVLSVPSLKQYNSDHQRTGNANEQIKTSLTDGDVVRRPQGFHINRLQGNNAFRKKSITTLDGHNRTMCSLQRKEFQKYVELIKRAR
jgi:hypothetical protein